MTDDRLNDVLEALNDMLDDNTVPKNVKSKIKVSIEFLNDKEEELTLKVNKALDELDEITDDINMEPYTRSQLWNIVSMLETIIS